MRKRLLSLFVIMCVLVGILPSITVFARSMPTNGTWEHLSWTYNDGVLTISGEGPMPDSYSPFFEWCAPEYGEHSTPVPIDTLIIEKGITTINSYLIWDCQIENFVVPDSVTAIYGMSGFVCGIKQINIPNNTKIITNLYATVFEKIILDDNHPYFSLDEQGALYNKEKTTLIKVPYRLSSFTIPETVNKVEDFAFGYEYDCYCKLEKMYYAGSSEEWEKVEISDSSGYNRFCSHGTLLTNIQCLGDQITTNYRSDLIENATLTFDYSDDYFNSSGYTYNHDLARASLALELSSYTAKGADYSSADEKSKNIRDLYGKLGFDEDSVELHNYDKSLDDGSDRAAYSFATKPLSDGSNLVAVVVRGGGYGAEWRSNFHVGSGSKHTGFNTPAEEIYSNLSNYISGLGGNTKIWITGYSRGAAIANIVAGKINETKLIDRDNLYAYTFATPNGVIVSETDAHNSIHDNIYNIVLPYDFVPKVAMDNWGYGRYGQTLMVENRDAFTGMASAYAQPNETYFNSLDTGKSYTIGKIESKAAIHLKNALLNLTESRAKYNSDYEGLVMDLMEWFMYRRKLGESFYDFAVNKYQENEKFPDALSYAYIYFYSNQSEFSLLYEFGLDANLVFSVILVMYMNGLELSDDELIEFFKNKLSNVLSDLGLIGTVEAVIGTVGNGCFEAHNPEYYISWLYGYDNPKYIYESSTYKKLTIACPVNVNVYDSTGTLVASVVNNEVVIDDLSIDVIGESAEIYFYEGEDIDDYTIEIEAYDDGDVNYSVTEYENNGIETRKINYANIPVSTGTKLSGYVPNGQKLDAEVYNLTSIANEEETTITFTEDLTDEELQNLTVDVTVEGDGSANDIYLATKGELVTLEAKPYFDATFIGWYDETGNLLSESAEYSFVLQREMNVIAKFTKCTAKTFFETIPQISEGTLTLDCSIVAGKDIGGKLYVALYGESGVFLGVKLIDVSVDADNEEIHTTEFDISELKETPKTVKLFLIKDMVAISIASSSSVISL